MKRLHLLLGSLVAMFMLSANSAWAQYVKVTDEDGTVSWVEIDGVINGTEIEIFNSNEGSAIDKNTKGSIDLNEVWSRSEGRGTHYQVTRIGTSAFRNCSGLTSVEIPSSVTSIGSFAFLWCGLTSVVIPSNVTSIGSNAFADCSLLISVEIPSSVTFIGNAAFLNCYRLTSIVIPSSVTSIERWTFAGCSGLTSVVIPSSVTNIGNSAFYGCHGLFSIEIPSSVTSIGYEAFSECSGLFSIVVESGNSVYDSRNNCNAIIETATNTLIKGCENTKIPSSVTSIGVGAFSSCSGMTSIEIPSSVTSIGISAFYGCLGLTSITSYITDVFETGDGAFSYCDKATLYVPAGLVSTYRSTKDWSRFSKIEEIPSIALVMACNNNGKVKVNGGVQFTNNIGEVSVYDGMESTFTFQPNENCELRQVLIDGLDVTRSVENNQLTTKVNEGSKMIVMFDNKGSDVNGDGTVDISDVVQLVNIILGQ